MRTFEAREPRFFFLGVFILFDIIFTNLKKDLLSMQWTYNTKKTRSQPKKTAVNQHDRHHQNEQSRCTKRKSSGEECYVLSARNKRSFVSRFKGPRTLTNDLKALSSGPDFL